MQTVILVIHLLLALGLIAVILVQRSEAVGLVSAVTAAVAAEAAASA